MSVPSRIDYRALVIASNRKDARHESEVARYLFRREMRPAG
jgi:hypothetical protein